MYILNSASLKYNALKNEKNAYVKFTNLFNIETNQICCAEIAFIL